MPDRRRARTALAVLTLVALVLITVDYRQQDEGPVASLQRGALTLFGPLQEGFAGVIRPIGGFFSSVAELGSLRDDNAALQSEIDELRRRMPSIATLERENSQLRNLLNMRRRLELTTTAAHVIGQPPGGSNFSVLINAGGSNGLRPGMAVVNADGLVGKLTEVTRTHARVELLISPEARYAVRIASTGESGLLQGQGPRPFQLEILDPEAEIPSAEEVVTRTFAGSTIPDGLPIGEIDERPPDAEFSDRYRPVRPYVDFTELEVVQVVLDAPRHPRGFDREDLIDGPVSDRPTMPDATEPPVETGTEPPVETESEA